MIGILTMFISVSLREIEKKYDVTVQSGKIHIPKKILMKKIKDKEGLICFPYDMIDSDVIKSGKKYKPSLNIIQDAFDEWKNYDSEISAIGFINYNFKDILYKHIAFENSNPNIPYLFFGHPKLIKEYKIELNNKVPAKVILKKDFEFRARVTD